MYNTRNTRNSPYKQGYRDGYANHSFNTFDQAGFSGDFSGDEQSTSKQLDILMSACNEALNSNTTSTNDSYIPEVGVEFQIGENGEINQRSPQKRTAHHNVHQPVSHSLEELNTLTHLIVLSFVTHRDVQLKKYVWEMLTKC